jgi:hypothetical protein
MVGELVESMECVKVGVDVFYQDNRLSIAYRRIVKMFYRSTIVIICFTAGVNAAA